jgi:hypothetical protein
VPKAYLPIAHPALAHHYRATPIDNWTSTPGGVVKIARGPKGERIRLLHDACGRLVERQVDRDGFRPQR